MSTWEKVIISRAKHSPSPVRHETAWNQVSFNLTLIKLCVLCLQSPFYVHGIEGEGITQLCSGFGSFRLQFSKRCMFHTLAPATLRPGGLKKTSMPKNQVRAEIWCPQKWDVTCPENSPISALELLNLSLPELSPFSQSKGQIGTSFFLSAAGFIPFLSLSLSVPLVSKPTLPRLSTRHAEQALPHIGQGRHAQKHHIWPVWARVEWEPARRRIIQFKLNENEFNPSFINMMINHPGNFKHGKAAKLNTHGCHPRQQNNTSRQDRVRGTGRMKEEPGCHIRCSSSGQGDEKSWICSY